MKTILVSACLLGENVKYNGGNNLNSKLIELLNGHNIIPICPEVLAGFSTPRIPIERKNEKVISKENIDVTSSLENAILLIIQRISIENIDFAIMKEKSPSCGVHLNYNGEFNGSLINRGGFVSESIQKIIPVFNEDEAIKILSTSY